MKLRQWLQGTFAAIVGVPTQTAQICTDTPIAVDAYFPKLSKETVGDIQKAIDQGRTCAVYNTIDHGDGKFSYVLGHNPGTMAPLFRVAKTGATVDIVDIHGVRKTYVLTDLGKQPKAGKMTNEKVKAEIRSGGEKIIFQFCVEDGIQFFVATPLTKGE